MLALNQGAQAETSSLTIDSLRRLLDMAFHVGLWDEGRLGFVIALAQDAPYENANFEWFRSRYPRFVYIDRVIVSPAARGQGVAGRLYDQLFEVARQSGHELVGCEVNVDPPNPISMAFHERHGFKAAGERRLPSGKTVRYLVRRPATVEHHREGAR